VTSERLPSGNWVGRTSSAVIGSWMSTSSNDPVRSASEGGSDSSSSFLARCDGKSLPCPSHPIAKMKRIWRTVSCPALEPDPFDLAPNPGHSGKVLFVEDGTPIQDFKVWIQGQSEPNKERGSRAWVISFGFKRQIHQKSLRRWCTGQLESRSTRNNQTFCMMFLISMK
jgi:hypothetical protein